MIKDLEGFWFLKSLEGTGFLRKWVAQSLQALSECILNIPQMSAKADHEIKASSQPGETETISASQKLCLNEKWGNNVQKEIIWSTQYLIFLGVFKDKGRSHLPLVFPIVSFVIMVLP